MDITYRGDTPHQHPIPLCPSPFSTSLALLPFPPEVRRSALFFTLPLSSPLLSLSRPASVHLRPSRYSSFISFLTLRPSRFLSRYYRPLRSYRSFRSSPVPLIPLPSSHSSSVLLFLFRPLIPLPSSRSSFILSPFSLKTPKVHHLNPQFTPPKPPIHTTFSFISPSSITPCILLNI